MAPIGVAALQKRGDSYVIEMQLLTGLGPGSDNFQCAWPDRRPAYQPHVFLVPNQSVLLMYCTSCTVAQAIASQLQTNMWKFFNVKTTQSLQFAIHVNSGGITT